MNRELKFRAFDKVEKKWLFGYETLGGFSLIGEVTLMGQLNTIPLERWNDIEIMQSTGLKDKAGKEIYEGDIVLMNESWDKAEVGRNEVGTWTTYQDDGGCCEWTEEDWKKSEIIGNRFEHPELLK